jgi:hypothetical protein
VIGDVAAPGDRLAVEVVEVLGAASGQEIVFDVATSPFHHDDPPFKTGSGNRQFN